MLLLSFVIILQSCYKDTRKPSTSHVATIFWIILQSCYKSSWHIPENPAHHMLLSSFANLLQRIVSIEPTHHMASHTIIFCIILQTLCSPSEDFGSRNKRTVVSSEVLYKGVSTRFGRRMVENCIEKTLPNFCSDFQNLRLRSINLLQKIIAPSRQHIASYHSDATIFCSHLERICIADPGYD
jgi:hypothetical protein